MDRAMGYLALARKGNLAELGEEPVGAAARAGRAYAVLVASDASEHTWRRAQSFVAGTDQQCLRLGQTKEEMGFAVGRTSLAIAAVTDPAMALALVKALGRERDAAAVDVLARKAQRKKQRLAETKAHQRNLRRGKK